MSKGWIVTHRFEYHNISRDFLRRPLSEHVTANNYDTVRCSGLAKYCYFLQIKVIMNQDSLTLRHYKLMNAITPQAKFVCFMTFRKETITDKHETSFLIRSCLKRLRRCSHTKSNDFFYVISIILYDSTSIHCTLILISCKCPINWAHTCGERWNTHKCKIENSNFSLTQRTIPGSILATWFNFNPSMYK